MYSDNELNEVIRLLNVGHIVQTEGNVSFDGMDGQLEYLQKIRIVTLSKVDPDKIVGAVLTDHGRKIAKERGL